MEKEINIAAVLKDKPTGTKLYSPIFGEGSLNVVTKGEQIRVAFPDSDNGYSTWIFGWNGKTITAASGEVMIFPSKQMRDWENFAWKKGDVLDSIDGGGTCLFDGWKDDTYTCFYGKYLYCQSQRDEEDVWQYRIVCNTADYYKSNAPESFIEILDNHYHGKLNPDTLEIGTSSLKLGEFYYFENNAGLCVVSKLEKDTADTFEFGDCVAWADKTPDEKEYYIYTKEPVRKDALKVMRLASKREIFEYKTIKRSRTLNTFDKVLVRDEGGCYWEPAFFLRMNEDNENYPYYCKSLECEGAESYKECVPYIGCEHLAFTTDPF